MFKLKKLIIPLSFFKKLSVLLPSQVKYLQIYQERVTNPILKELIGTLLKKPQIKDNINEYNYSIDYNKYKSKIEENKPTILEKLFKK